MAMDSDKGFTIVELLIVIVVIAILAAISLVAYNGIRERAQASSIASELKATKKAFLAYKETTGASSWWMDTDATALTGGSNPEIASIISAQPEFRNFLQNAPNTSGLGTSSGWRYDNDGDTYNGCSAATSGVNLAVSAVTNTSLAQSIDAMIDDGNLACGKMRLASSWLLYSLSN